MAKRGRPNKFIGDIYNEDIKFEFLFEKYENNDSVESNSKVFRRTFDIEKRLGKDIAIFNTQDYKILSDEVTFGLSDSTLKSMKSVLNVYKEWFVSKGYKMPGDEIIDIIPLYNNQSIEDVRKKYLRSIKDLHSIVNACINPQDAACYILAFYGFNARDMLKITISNIKDNCIMIKDRAIKMEKELITVIEAANNQEIYFKNNGVASQELKSLTIHLDKNEPTIIKGVTNKGRSANALANSSINVRITKILSVICERHPELNLNVMNLSEIKMSGLLHQLYDIEIVRPLEVNDYKLIRNVYGLDEKNYDKTRELYNLWKTANGIQIKYFESEFDKHIPKMPKSVNYLELHKFQEFIGDLGEKFVLDLERKRLEGTKYAAKVTDAPSKDGRLGYDILSFKKDGTEIFIEVKTEATNKENDFYITNTEKVKAEQFFEQGKEYLIYRVHNILAEDKKDVRCEIIKDLFNDENYDVKPHTWKVSKLDK